MAVRSITTWGWWVTNRESDDISRKNLAMRNAGGTIWSVLASASLGQPLDSPKTSFGLPHGYLLTKAGIIRGTVWTTQFQSEQKKAATPKQMIERNQKKASTTTALKDSGTVFDSITPIPTPNEHSAIDPNFNLLLYEINIGFSSK